MADDPSLGFGIRRPSHADHVMAWLCLGLVGAIVLVLAGM